MRQKERGREREMLDWETERPIERDKDNNLIEQISERV